MLSRSHPRGLVAPVTSLVGTLARPNLNPLRL